MSSYSTINGTITCEEEYKSILVDYFDSWKNDEPEGSVGIRTYPDENKAELYFSGHYRNAGRLLEPAISELAFYDGLLDLELDEELSSSTAGEYTYYCDEDGFAYYREQNKSSAETQLILPLFGVADTVQTYGYGDIVWPYHNGPSTDCLTDPFYFEKHAEGTNKDGERYVTVDHIYNGDENKWASMITKTEIPTGIYKKLNAKQTIKQV